MLISELTGSRSVEPARELGKVRLGWAAIDGRRIFHLRLARRYTTTTTTTLSHGHSL